jgi:hypothetical protein
MLSRVAACIAACRAGVTRLNSPTFYQRVECSGRWLRRAPRLRTAGHRGKEQRQQRPPLRGRQVSLLMRTHARGHARNDPQRLRGVRIRGSARTCAREWARISSSLQYPAVPYSPPQYPTVLYSALSNLRQSALSVRLVRSCIFDAAEIPINSCNCRTELEKQVRPASTTCHTTCRGTRKEEHAFSSPSLTSPTGPAVLR